jgi:hypothetical protein
MGDFFKAKRSGQQAGTRGFPDGGGSINFNNSFPYFKLVTVDFADHLCLIRLFPQTVHAQDLLCGRVPVPGHGRTHKHQPKDKQHFGVGKAK